MIDLAVTVLLYAILAVSLFQPSAPRLLTALIFAFEVNSHDLFFSGLDGFLYYASAALTSLLVIILTSGINPTPRMVITIQKICLASIVANAIGWALWFNYISSIYYNMAFILIYGWAFFALIKRDHIYNVGGYTVSEWRSCFRFDHNPIYLYFYKNKG